MLANIASKCSPAEQSLEWNHLPLPWVFAAICNSGSWGSPHHRGNPASSTHTCRGWNRCRDVQQIQLRKAGLPVASADPQRISADPRSRVE